MTVPDTPRRLVTIAGAAIMLACSPEMVARLLDQGELTRVHLGGRAVRIEISDVDDYIERHRSPRNNLGCSDTDAEVAA